NRSAQNLFCFRINTDFHETLCLSFLKSPADPDHRIFRGKCSAPGFSYLGVGHAASAEWRICIQSGRLDSVRHAAMISVEKIGRDDLIVVVGSVRKGAAAIAVTQRPYGGYVRLQLIVNNDVAASVGRNSGAVEAQVLRIRRTSHG